MRQEKDVPRITEKEFQAQIVEYARLRGWLVYHPFDSRKSEPGFPDLVLVRPENRVQERGHLVFAELKSSQGWLRGAQRLWLGALRTCPGAEVYVWRPDDWPEIEKVLK